MLPDAAATLADVVVCAVPAAVADAVVVGASVARWDEDDAAVEVESQLTDDGRLVTLLVEQSFRAYWTAAFWSAVLQVLDKQHAMPLRKLLFEQMHWISILDELAARPAIRRWGNLRAASGNLTAAGVLREACGLRDAVSQFLEPPSGSPDQGRSPHRRAAGRAGQPRWPPARPREPAWLSSYCRGRIQGAASCRRENRRMRHDAGETGGHGVLGKEAMPRRAMDFIKAASAACNYGPGLDRTAPGPARPRM